MCAFSVYRHFICLQVLDLPWVDFAWFFPRRPHKLRTPPWSVLQPQLVEQGGRVAWGSKVASHRIVA